MSLTNTENPCLDVLMSIKEDGTPVQVQNCNLSKKQKWKVEEVECPDLSALLGTDPNESVDPNADPDSESGNTGTDTDNNTDANQNSGGTTQTEIKDDCCTIETSKCLACKQKISEQIFCQIYPRTNGCNGDSTLEEGACCTIDHAKCFACENQSTIESVCLLVPDMAGC